MDAQPRLRRERRALRRAVATRLRESVAPRARRHRSSTRSSSSAACPRAHRALERASASTGSRGCGRRRRLFAGCAQRTGLELPELLVLVARELRLDIELAANETAHGRRGQPRRPDRCAVRLPRDRRDRRRSAASSPGCGRRRSARGPHPASRGSGARHRAGAHHPRREGPRMGRWSPCPRWVDDELPARARRRLRRLARVRSLPVERPRRRAPSCRGSTSTASTRARRSRTR